MEINPSQRNDDEFAKDEIQRLTNSSTHLRRNRSHTSPQQNRTENTEPPKHTPNPTNISLNPQKPKTGDRNLAFGQSRQTIKTITHANSLQPAADLDLISNPYAQKSSCESVHIRRRNSTHAHYTQLTE